MVELWQSPYVNVFKHYGVGQWKKCQKEGDVSSSMDRVVKCPIYKISGIVPANNYITVPKHSSQSAGLTGTQMCILFKPVPGQFFTIHLEVISTCGVLIRVSTSNIYKQFKASATWLQFPFVVDSTNNQWTVLLFNFPNLLRKYVNREYSHIKSIKLCANMLVKNVFTTSKPYNPHVTDKKVMKIDDITKPGDEPFPREMRFPVPNGHAWSEFYQFIKFPTTTDNLSVSLKNKPPSPSINPSFVSSKNGDRVFRELPIVRNKASNAKLSKKSSSKKASERIEEDFQNMSLIENVTITSTHDAKKPVNTKTPPICSLQKILGFGPCKKIVFSGDTECIYYAAGSVIIKQRLSDKSQSLITGHTDNILTFSVDERDEFVASSQKESPLVRIWAVKTQECVALVKSWDESCSVLQFSGSDKALLGMASSRSKSKMILWDTSMLSLKGDITIISEGSCSEGLLTAQMSHVTSGKIASCSNRAVQIWRLKAGKLKSCSLSTFYGLEYALRDVKWGSVTNNTDNLVYVATLSGIIIEINSSKATVSRCIDICAIEGPGVKSINSISIHGAFAITGTDDGSLKVWDPLFNEVILNVEHEAAVTHCGISSNGLKLLAITEADSVGVLDASTRSYTTVLRSHSKKITAVAIDPCRRHLASISPDGSLRVWDMDTMTQVYEVFSAGETPTTVAYHPYKGSIVTGYSKGSLRVIEEGEVTEEHFELSSPITSTTFLPNGECLYVSDALGTLLMYPANKSELVQLKSIKHIVAKGGHRGPAAIRASRDSRLVGFVGPTEHCVTVLESGTLSCLLKLDLSYAVSSCLDSVQRLYFGTVLSRDLLVGTSSGKVLRVDTKSGLVVADHQPYANTAPQLLVTDKFIVTANQRKFNVCDYASLSTVQKYISHDNINHMTMTPSLNELVTCGDTISIWRFKGRMTSQLVDDVTITKRVSFDELTGVNKSGEMAVAAVGQEYDEVLTAPTPAFLEPVQSDVRLEDTLDRSEEKALDMSSLLLDPTPPPEPQPHVKTVVVSDEECSQYDDDALEEVSAVPLSEGEDGVPGALAPSNGQRPFQLSPEDKSPRSPEPSPEPPLSLRHLNIDTPSSSLSEKRYMAAPDSCGIELVTLVGSEPRARGNVVWRGTTIFYSLGNVIIAEDLRTSQQTHLIEHTETVTSLTCSEEGLLASCSGAHRLHPSQICLWNVDTYQLLRTLNYHEYQIQCLEFTSDHSYLISIGNYKENALVLWDLTTYAVHTVAKTDCYVNAVACDPQNGTEFVTAGKSVQFWLLDQKQELSVATGSLPLQFQRSIGEDVEFTSVIYSDNGLVFVGTRSGSVTVWDPRSTTCLLHWSAHNAEIDVLCYHNSSLITGGVGKSLKLWDIQNTDTEDTSVMLHDEIELDAAVVSCVMDNHLNLGIVGTVSGILWYVNWQDMTSIRLVGGHPDKINDIAVGQGDLVSLAVEDGSLRVWNREQLEQTVQFLVLNTSCTCVVFRPGSWSQLSAGYGDGTLRTFDLGKVSLLCKMAPHRQPLSRVKYSPNGQVLLSGDSSGLVSVINAETGLIMRIISDHRQNQATVTSIDFSGLSQDWLLATADRRVSVWQADWEVDNNKMVSWLSFPAPSFSPCGTPQHSYTPLPPSLALFSPLEADTLLYTGYGVLQELLFYNYRTKETTRKVDLAHWAASLDLAPNSNLIVLGGHDRLVTVIDYTSGSFQDYVAHDGEVSVVRYSDNGNVVLSAANSGLAIWRVKV